MFNKIKRVVSAVLSAAILTSCMCFAPASAAEAGTMLANAISVSFDKSYTKTWTKSSDNLYCYNKIVVPKKGVITITAPKVVDDDGEYGGMEFRLYDQMGELVWANDTYKTRETPAPSYIKSVGLEAGTYYLNLMPSFRVISGNIDTTYSVSFKATNYCEVEPNDGLSSATMLKSGKMYTATYGSDGASREGSDDDCYKFAVKKNDRYLLTIENYDKLDATTAIFNVLSASGKEIRYTETINNDGNTALVFRAEDTGNYFFRIENYSGSQISYKIGIKKYAPKLAKTTVSIPSKYPNLGEIKVEWEEVDNAEGYQINYSPSKKTSKGKIHTIEDDTDYCYLDGLTKGKTYYIRVRAYYTTSSGKKYAKWSAAKKVVLK